MFILGRYVFNRPKLIKYKERHTKKLCELYHKINDPVKKQKCLQICISKSIELEKLENEEKSF